MAEYEVPKSGDDDNINYSGPSKEYVPHIGSHWQTRTDRVNRRTSGYYDLDFLRPALEKIIENNEQTIKDAEAQLENLNLIIQEGSIEDQAQDVMWPVGELGDKKPYLSFAQYRHVKTSKKRAADVLQRSYENKARGPSGSNAIDVICIAEFMKDEATQIGKFLDSYIGERPNDTAEYRTIELLQDWASNALNGTGRVRRLLEKGEGAAVIPAAELRSLTDREAKQYQSVFQVQVTAINRQITEIEEDINKEFGPTSDAFYNQFLGPAINFRKRVGKTVESFGGSTGFLNSQAKQIAKPMRQNLEVMLADQMRRNKRFGDKVADITNLMNKRDKLNSMLNQLSTIGSPVTQVFTSDVDVSPEELNTFSSLTDSEVEAEAALNPYESAHDLLDGRLSDEAHPQYLLETGDTLKGVFDFADDIDELFNIPQDPEGHNLVFDGMRPRHHKHRGIGIDGTEQLNGCEAIVAGTLCAALVNKGEIVCAPEALRELGSKECFAEEGKVDLDIGFDCEGEEYEIQIVPICPPQDPSVLGCVIGHKGDYPEQECKPWVTARRYLNMGPDAGMIEGNLPLIPIEEDLTYGVTSTFSMALNADFFVVGMDSNEGNDFEVHLCKRNADDEGELYHSLVAAIEVGTTTQNLSQYGDGQDRVQVARVNDTDFIVGCMDNANESGNDLPTLLLIRSDQTEDAESLTVIDRITLWEETYDTSYGVMSLDVDEEQGRWVAGFVVEQATVDLEPQHKARVAVGTLKRSPGGTTKDVLERRELKSYGSGYGWAGPEVRLMGEKRIVLMFREQFSNPTRDRGYYVTVLEHGPETLLIESEGELYQVSDENFDGYAYIEIIDSDEFVVLWSEEETSCSAEDPTPFAPVGSENPSSTTPENVEVQLPPGDFGWNPSLFEGYPPTGACAIGQPLMPGQDIQRTNVSPNGVGLIIGGLSAKTYAAPFIEMSDQISNFNWVNAGHNGTESAEWAGGDPTGFARADAALSANAYTPEDVQVVVSIMGHTTQAADKDSFVPISNYKSEMLTILDTIRTRYPNTKIVYMAGRETGRFSTNLNQEPSAYRHGTATQELLTEYTGPLEIVFGPYLWEDGGCGRPDNFFIVRGEFTDSGSVANEEGSNKYAQLMISYFSNQPWFATKDV